MNSLSLFKYRKHSVTRGVFSVLLSLSVLLQTASGIFLAPTFAYANTTEVSVSTDTSNESTAAVEVSQTPKEEIVTEKKDLESSPVDNSTDGSNESEISKSAPTESSEKPDADNGQKEESSSIDVLKEIAMSVNTYSEVHEETSVETETFSKTSSSHTENSSSSSVEQKTVYLAQGENIDSNSCPQGTDMGGVTLSSGKMLWHFVLVGSNTTYPAKLSATWGTKSVSGVLPTTVNSGVQHYYVVTDQPETLANAYVKYAVAGKNATLRLNLSHCVKTEDLTKTGSVRFCKAIKVDGVLKNSGSSLPAGKFQLTLKRDGNAVKTVEWNTANFNVSSDVLGNDGTKDADCVTVNDLPFGTYRFTKEVIWGDNWKTPVYTQKSGASISSMIPYCGEEAGEECGSCTTGDITVSSDKSVQTITVLNKYVTPPVVVVNQKPVITVTGVNPVEITQGSTYTDLGATALDAEDGDITANIVTTGSVDTNTVGTYTITYNVKDSKGLAADTKTRTVKVVTPLYCNAPLDVMLVIDRSGSMNDDGANPEQPLTDAKLAAKGFIDTLSATNDKVGVVSFSTSAALNQALTSNFAAAKGAMTFNANGGTNIGEGLAVSTTELDQHTRSAAKKAIILLSDGKPNNPTSETVAAQYALTKATFAKSKGYVIYTIGLGSGADAQLMKQIASTPTNYFSAPTVAQLAGIYQAISQIECQRDPATVTGKVVNDVNGNGSVETGDVGVAGRTVTATLVGGTTAFRTVTTDTNGNYAMVDLPQGSYDVCTVLPQDWRLTYPTTLSGCYRLDLTSGQLASGKDFLTTEVTKPTCSDGKDNDGDGKIDYPADTGCDNGDDNDENNKPVITVGTPNPLRILLGSTLGSLVVSALDAEDGDITANIVTTGSVDTNTVGTYTITYNVKDSKGLAADTKTRTVIVATQCSDGVDNDGDGKIDMQDGGCDNGDDNDENNKPVITVVVPNPTEVLLGSTYTDLGATALDAEDGDITANIVTTGSVDTNTVGTYTITYNVKDSKGLAADTKTRTVIVKEVVTTNTPPVITVLGDNPLTVLIGGTFTDPGATAADLEDGNITSSIVATGTVNTTVVGTYTITYNVKDSKGLAAEEKSRVVKVVSLCSDGIDNDGDSLVDFPNDLGCESIQDNDENNKPVITRIGDATITINRGTAYTDLGATAADVEDGNITTSIVVGGSVDTNTVGTYTITYNVKDSKGLAADEVTRTVNVVSTGCTSNCGGGSTPHVCSDGADNDGDGLADYPRDPGCSSSIDDDERDNGPVITLKGNNPDTVNVGTTYTDPGATASDPEDGDITSKIVASSTVNTSTPGAYTITYNVSDKDGHAATPVTRTVNVVAVGCTSNCGGGGGSVSLSIYNEKITTTSVPGQVVITWDTNLAADGRVVYGLNSTVAGSAPLYGYLITTATDTVLTTSHSMTISGLIEGVTYYFRPVSSNVAQTVVGIELTRKEAAKSCEYLKEYMRYGITNNPVEVTKLQQFLKDFEGNTSLSVTGFFDLTTDAAVRAFQDKYKNDVLIPWNLPGNTGYVYYTTQKKINEIYCQRAFPLNDTQVREIEAFKALLNQINTSGGASNTVTLPIVGSTGGSSNIASNGGAGSVAGASTENGESKTNIAEGENRGKIALADLLATVPNVSQSLKDKAEVETAADEKATGETLSSSTERTGSGIRGAMASVATSLKLDTCSLAAWMLFVLILILLVMYIRLWMKYRKDKEMGPFNS